MIPRISLTCLAAIIVAAIFGESAWADTVYSIRQDGMLLQLNSDGTSKVISYNGPAGNTLCLAVDSYGNLYTANNTTGMIEEYSTIGKWSNFASYASPATAFASGLTVDGAGNVYLSTGGNSIFKFTPGGFESVFDHTGLIYAQGMACDREGNLYAANGGVAIIKFSSAGTYLGVLARGSGLPVNLAFDSSGNLYASYFNQTSSWIEKYSSAGADLGALISWNGLGVLAGGGLAVDSNGNLFAVGAGVDGNGYYEFDPQGNEVEYWSQLNGGGIAIETPEPTSFSLLLVGLPVIISLRGRFSRQ